MTTDGAPCADDPPLEDTMTNRTPQRVEFLGDILTTAIEGGINYWAEVVQYKPDEPYAVVRPEDEARPYSVSIDTIAHGIQVLTTGENKGRSFTMSGADYWKQFLLANRTNGEDGDFDADVADNILQAGLFGEVVYG